MAAICHVAGVLLLLVLVLAVQQGEAAAAHSRYTHRRGVTSRYKRKLEASEDMPLDADVFAVPPGKNAPQQVHITLGDQTGTAMTVSWVTVEVASSTVRYGRANMDDADLELTAEGAYTRYSYYNYTSGFIHHCTLQNLEHATKYYYAVGDETVRTFWFTTPPAPGPDVPVRFGLIGDLGQTADSNSTLTHYETHPGDAVLFVGDLSYADKHPYHDNRRWDIKNRTHAYYAWYRNHDGNKVAADTMWFTNRYHMPNHDETLILTSSPVAYE